MFINDREITIFSGATVRDAVRSYSGRSSEQLEKGLLKVVDRFGNETDAGGELTAGQKLYLKKRRHA
jgi:hypothetical protein